MKDLIRSIVPIVVFVCLAVTSSSDLPVRPGASTVDSASQRIGLRHVGQLGGTTQAVAAQGKYAYLGIGMSLAVLDVSRPSHIRQVGSTVPLGGTVTGITLSKKRALVTVGDTGLHVIDISEPRQPRTLGSYDSPGYAEGVAVVGDHAYVADGWRGLTVVDTSTPQYPTEVGLLPTFGYALDVAVQGNLAYLAAGAAGVIAISIAEPTQPVEIGTYDTPGYAYGLTFSPKNRTLYVADGWEGVRILNISSAGEIEHKGSYKTPGWAFGVALQGKTLYVADAFKGLRVLDVSNPSSPNEVGAFEADGHAGKVVVARSRAYIADRSNGLRIINVSKKSKPTQVALYSPLGFAEAVAVRGRYAYVAAKLFGLVVVDISSASRPIAVGTYDIPQANAMGVVTSGNYAYVIVMSGIGGVGGLHVVDISNATRPIRAAFAPAPGAAYRDIALAGEIVYIANETGLELWDVSVPRNPTLASSIILRRNRREVTAGVAVSGSSAYVAGGGGLYIVDVSNPRSPRLISRTRVAKWVKGVDVDVSAGRAYVAHAGGDDLMIFDVSDPSRPVKLGAYRAPGMPERVLVANNLVYLALGGNGLHSLDVLDPWCPTLAHVYDTPGNAMSSAITRRYIYIADGDAGMAVFSVASAHTEPRGRASARPTPGLMLLADSAGKRTRALGLRASNTASLSSATEIDARGLPAAYQQPDLVLLPSATHAARRWVVTSTADNGPGSLRDCIENSSRGDTITFDPSVFRPNNPATIQLHSNLPSIDKGNVTIDASNAGVILDGTAIQNGGGINIKSDRNTIQGVQIRNFSYTGIGIDPNADHNTIGGDRRVGRGPLGQGNLVSGNGQGIGVQGDFNVIVGNLIGTDVSGTIANGNRKAGIAIYKGHNNRVGGLPPGQRNIISSNWDGVNLNAGSAGNVIIGNYIGTDVEGRVALGNKDNGVVTYFGCPGNLVKDNLISGNGQDGVHIIDAGSSYNTVVGNLIGTDATGTRPIGNRGSGVAVGYGGAVFNRIGGPGRKRNLISGNRTGIELHGREAGNLVLGNLIGTDISGTWAIGNKEGIYVVDDSSYNFIGGGTPADRNVISGNVQVGITVGGGERIFILGNHVGMTGDGAPQLWNGGPGIEIYEAVTSVVVSGNSISGRPGLKLSGDTNTVNRNIFSSSWDGMEADGAGNLIYQNAFIDSQSSQAIDSGDNHWDRAGRGNYWSDYTGSDANGDGIGDTPYYINPNGVDHYPLMGQSNKLTIRINPQGSGNVTIIPNKSNYSFGENVQLSATPKSGYKFSFWLGDCPSGPEGNNPLTLAVKKKMLLTANFISSATSFISISKKFINFGAIFKRAKTPDQKFRILNIGKETLHWQITDNADWLSSSPSSGAGSALINVSVNPSELSVGTYTATIYVSSSNSSQSNSFQAITVTLIVISLSEAGFPLGEWDKPLESSYIHGGCFPFSGWALDRIGIESVKVYRLKVSADDSSMPDEIYIGDAFFVEGARPDVEVLYPQYPQCGQAGWGYNLVSGLLPGDGLYTFIIKARSVSGEEIELGRRKINIDNTYSFNPFGALDFPKPGGVVSENFYNVTGWGLSKGQSHISEVNLYIDSEYKKTLSLGFPRPEIKLILPGYTDSDFPTFIATIDTTSLSNDYHTAFLIAGDSEERQAVLGSRYFYRANEMEGLRGSEQNMIQDSMGILKGKIYGNKIEKMRLEGLEHIDKEVTIKINELKSISIKDFSEEDDDITYKALYKGEECLPLGMSFDEKKGIISWLPIPGFKGEFPIDVLKFKKSILTVRKRIVFNVE